MGSRYSDAHWEDLCGTGWIGAYLTSFTLWLTAPSEQRDGVPAELWRAIADEKVPDIIDARTEVVTGPRHYDPMLQDLFDIR